MGASPEGRSSGEVTPESEIGSGADEEKKVSTTENSPTIATGETTTPTNLHDILPTMRDEEKEALEDKASLEDPTKLNHVLKGACIASTVLKLIICLIIPLPMFLSQYIFSKGFFTGWVVISFIWVFFALFTCAILPIIEATEFFKDLIFAVKGENWGRKKA